MYLLMYLFETKQKWIDFDKPIVDQFNEIAKFKINTSAKDFVSEKTEFLYPCLKYAYELKFEERPCYN